MMKIKQILRQKIRIIREGKIPNDIDFVPLLERRTPEPSTEDKKLPLSRQASSTEGTHEDAAQEQLVDRHIDLLFPGNDENESEEPDEYAILEEESS